MSSKTRKLIWSVPLMATLAVVGALAVFVALGLPNAAPAEAQGAIVPLAPFVTVVPGPAKLTVSWYPGNNGGSPITGYTLKYKVSTGESTYTTVLFDASTQTYTITELTNGTAYKVLVNAKNAIGSSLNSEVKSGTPGAVHTSVPRNVSISKITDESFEVTWDAPDDSGGSTISGYTVEIAPADGDADCTDSTTPSDRKSECTDLSNNQAYTVTVTTTVNGTPGGTAAPGTAGAKTKKSATVTASEAKISGFSTSPNGKADIRLDIKLSTELAISGSVVLFLEDDFIVPDTISRDDVFFSSTGANNGGGALIRAARIVVDSDDYDHTGVAAHTIRVSVPDMNPDPDTESSVPDNAVLTLRITNEAGIRNDTQAGTYEVAYEILGPTESINGDFEMALPDLVVPAKVALSDENNKRDYELTITGSGLNSGRKATAYVLENHTGSMPSCATVVADGESVGSETVGGDHTAVVVDTVTTDDYSPGKTNYICMVDDNSPTKRMTTVEQFEMEASVAASPAEVNSGDEVTVAIRDFEDFDSADDVKSVELAGEKVWTSASGDTDNFVVRVDVNDKELTFDMPGGVSGSVEINVKVGDTSKQTSITVNPSGLVLSKAEVAPNESIVITGSGFSERSKILVTKFTIDGHQLVVDESGTEDSGAKEYVEITSAGTFSASVNIWTVDDATSNPALDAGTYKIEVEDVEGFTGSTEVTILPPTLVVNPTSAGPRDYIKISGANWPVSTSDDDREVEIEVDGRDRNADIDSTGRFFLEYQLKATIQIGIEHTIKVTYTEDDRDDIEEEITFIVPSSNVVITPTAAAPGETIDLDMTGMPIHRLVDDVIIDGADRLGNANFNTNADGAVMVTGVLVPYADPGFYPVRVKVGDETAVVQLEILAEPRATGAATPLPDALTDLGDNLVRVFFFNSDNKVWSFFDPREEFAELNTLTEMAAGQPYWILVSAGQENVVLNGKTKRFSCEGGDCWNQLVW